MSVEVRELPPASLASYAEVPIALAVREVLDVVETRNVNVPACRFYARRGCTLAAIRRGAYPALPNEAQLLWELALG